MSAPEIWSYRASGGYLDKHPIASERWSAGDWRTNTYGVPGQYRSRAVQVEQSPMFMYEKLGEYLQHVQKALEAAAAALRHYESRAPGDYETGAVNWELRLALSPVIDPDTVPTEPPTEGSDT